MKFKTLLSILLLLLTITGIARPAKPGILTISQPDGSTFQAYIRGDEFARIKTTISGHAIIQEEDGWWCYAQFSEDGSRHSTGYRVGERMPGIIEATTLDIPYGKIHRIGEQLRSVAVSPRLLNTDNDTSEITEKHGLVILAQFSDFSFKYTRQDFVDLLTKEGFDNNGATGCAIEYFNAQFDGKIDFKFDVSEIITLGSRRAYYGSNDSNGNDKNPAQMIADACRLASESGIDFSIYDDDNNGEVDNIFVFFAGGDEAEGAGEDCIWSHAWFVYDGAGIDLILNEKRINRYACTAEISILGENTEVLAGIGTFCHEYSHTFGLPDFYDTDYEESGGWAAGMWLSTSPMDAGNMNNNNNTPPYLNAVERTLLGISEPVLIESNGTYRLEPIHYNGQVYRLDTDREDEYYLLECRSEEGWDKYIGGKGMLVYHIDRNGTAIRRWTTYNTVNVDPSHQYADLIEADSRKDNFLRPDEYYYSTSNIKSIFFPYGEVNSITPTTGLKFWSGKTCPIAITNICWDGDAILFNVIGLSGDGTPPVATGIKTEAFMDAAIIRFSSSNKSYEGEATVSWGRTDKEATITKVSPYEPGKYSITLEGLEPGNKTYSVKIWFENEIARGETKSTSFMTSKAAPVSWPYIYLGKAAVGNGTFDIGTELPLRVYNAGKAEAIEWSFNGKPIESTGDGYYEVTQGGTLKAFVYWEDGGVDVLEKHIDIAE